MNISPQEQEYMERFVIGEYRPELLYSDKDILSKEDIERTKD